MIRILIIFLLIPSVLLAQFYSPSYAGNVSKNNLYVNYDFSKSSSYPGSGTTVYSTTTNAVSASLANSPTYFSDPGYLRFIAGSSQYMIIGDFKNAYSPVSPSTRSGVFTLSLWFNPTALNGVVVSDLDNTIPGGGYHTSDIEMVAGYLKFSVWPKNTVLTTATTVTLNEWHHVVLVYTGTQVKAYLDNTLVGTATYTRSGPHMGSYTAAQYFGIAAYDGTHMGSGAYGSFLLADVKFFSAALGDGEVNSIYQQEKSNYDLVFYLDGGNTTSLATSGATAWNDISGHAKSGDIGAGMSYNATASGSMYFNGASTAYSNFSCGLNGTSTITVEMWVKPTTLSGGMFFGFYRYDVFTTGGGLGYNTAGGDLYGINSTQTSGFVNTWKHYVFVMNAGSVTSNKIYVNGVSQTLALRTGTIQNANTNFNGGIGRIACWANDNAYMQQMYITKFKIYDRELTQAEITNNFNKDKARHGL